MGKTELRPARKDLTGLSSFERICLYYDSKEGQVELSSTDESKLERLKHAYKTQIEGGDKQSMIDLHRDYFDISERTAWTDFKESKLLYGSVDIDFKIDKALHLQRLELVLGQAMSAGDFKAADKILHSIMSVSGFDKAEQDVIRPEDVQLPAFEVSFFKELTPFKDLSDDEIEKRVNAARKVKKNRIQAQDTDFEEVYE